MLKRRLIAAVTALLLASLGAMLLFNYVGAADQRAMAGMETVTVLVASGPVPKGTSGDALDDLVALQTFPAKAVVTGSLTSVKQITGQVATVDLQPGEQLLAARFADPASLEESNTVKVPAGMQQITVPFERPRMLGGLLVPGDTVGIFFSFPVEGTKPPQTHLLMHKVLVTQVGEPSAPRASAEPEEGAAAVAETLTVTFAVTAADAERIIFGAENARLWLSLEPASADTTGTKEVNSGNVAQ